MANMNQERKRRNNVEEKKGAEVSVRIKRISKDKEMEKRGTRCYVMRYVFRV